MKTAIHFPLAAVLIALAAGAQAQTGSSSTQTGSPSTRAASPAPRANGAAAPANTSPDYRMVPGDKLRVEVYKDAALSQNVQIRPDGKITLPYIGDMPAAGMVLHPLGRDRHAVRFEPRAVVATGGSRRDPG